MAVNYSLTVKQARLEAVRSALNASGGGKVKLMTSADAALCTVPLETSIGAPVGGVLTVISTAKQGTATGAGAAAKASLQDGANVDVATGLTVGTSASDINLNDVNLQVNSQVTLNSGTITAT
jgi:hypothetical protein